MNKHRIFITGGLGFIGLNIVKHLLNSEEVENITLLDRAGSESTNPKLSFIQGGIEDFDTSKLENFSAAVLLAGISDKNISQEEATRINVNSNKKIIEALAKNSHVKIIFPSSQLVYGDIEEPKTENVVNLNPSDEYAKSKLACEEVIKTVSNISYSILRISNPFGPHIPQPQNYNYANQLLLDLLNDKTIELFAQGEPVKNYIPVQNLSSIIEKIIIENLFENEVLNVGHWESYSMKDFYEKAADVFKSGKITLTDKSAVSEKNIINTDKLYSKLPPRSLLTLEDSLIEFKNFFESVESPNQESFLKSYK